MRRSLAVIAGAPLLMATSCIDSGGFHVRADGTVAPGESRTRHGWR
ncbi:hypothetical protein [Longimicrobium sp.]|nr:hypothetical protein [Longimicrobium sp.]HSU12914.1 hypothetical protein [Longimicrobium sp.]